MRSSAASNLSDILARFGYWLSTCALSNHVTARTPRGVYYERLGSSRFPFVGPSTMLAPGSMVFSASRRGQSAPAPDGDCCAPFYRWAMTSLFHPSVGAAFDPGVSLFIQTYTMKVFWRWHKIRKEMEVLACSLNERTTGPPASCHHLRAGRQIFIILAQSGSPSPRGGFLAEDQHGFTVYRYSRVCKVRSCINVTVMMAEQMKWSGEIGGDDEETGTYVVIL